jgi:transposase-like protein
MDCPHCQSQQVVKNGTHRLQDGGKRQNYWCQSCHKRFSERTGTPMARLRKPTATVTLAMKMRGEGMGVRASSRVLDLSHATILRWEERVSRQASDWSPSAPDDADVTLELDELYTRVGENLPPQSV